MKTVADIIATIGVIDSIRETYRSGRDMTEKDLELIIEMLNGYKYVLLNAPVNFGGKNDE